MRSVPGIKIASGRGVRILCPKCGSHMTTLPEGESFARRGERSTGTRDGVCHSCGHAYSVPVVSDA